MGHLDLSKLNSNARYVCLLHSISYTEGWNGHTSCISAKRSLFFNWAGKLFQDIDVNLNKRNCFRSKVTEHELGISTFACRRISTHQTFIWTFWTQQARHLMQFLFFSKSNESRVARVWSSSKLHLWVGVLTQSPRECRKKNKKKSDTQNPAAFLEWMIHLPWW